MGELEKFIEDKKDFREMNISDVGRLKEIISNDENLRQRTIDWLCSKEEITGYHYLTSIDDYGPCPIGKSPYDILAEIGKGSRKAVDCCIRGMNWPYGTLAPTNATRALAEMIAPEHSEQIISKIGEYLTSHPYGSASDEALKILVRIGKEGITCIRECLQSENEKVVNSIKREIAHSWVFDEEEKKKLEKELLLR